VLGDGVETPWRRRAIHHTPVEATIVVEAKERVYFVVFSSRRLDGATPRRGSTGEAVGPPRRHA